MATLSFGCLDVDPLPFHAPPEAGDLDVEEDASSDADLRAVCRQCIEAPVDPGPGCGDQYLACAANEKCLAIFECVLAKGCTSGATQPDIINCALPCVAETGAVNVGDPAVMLILPIAPCVLGPCKPACGGSP
jgi:hypothetical protein